MHFLCLLCHMAPGTKIWEASGRVVAWLYLVYHPLLRLGRSNAGSRLCGQEATSLVCPAQHRTPSPPPPESRVCFGKPVRCPYIQGAQEMGAPSFILQRACRAAFPPACFHSLSGPPVSRGRLSDFLSGCGFQGTRPCWVYRCPECACSQQLPISAPCPLPVPHSLQCSFPLLTVRLPGEEGPLSPDPGCWWIQPEIDCLAGPWIFHQGSIVSVNCILLLFLGGQQVWERLGLVVAAEDMLGPPYETST